MPDSFDDHDPFADEPLSDDAAREIEQRMNIHRLKNEANDIAGGQMTGFESPDLPPGISEQFWQNVVAFEKAPRVSGLQKLEADGLSMPPEAELSDDELSARLWQIIEWMASGGIYLSDTNHLSDRELYEWLREEGLTEPMANVPGMSYHTSPIGSCGEDDMIINFRFFADDESRAMWMKDFPDYEMPAKETAPFERDHLLPQATYAEMEMEWDDDDDLEEDQDDALK